MLCNTHPPTPTSCLVPCQVLVLCNTHPPTPTPTPCLIPCQVLALFNKAVRKLYGHLRAAKEAAVDRSLPRPRHVELLPHQVMMRIVMVVVLEWAIAPPVLNLPRTAQHSSTAQHSAALCSPCECTGH